MIKSQSAKCAIALCVSATLTYSALLLAGTALLLSPEFTIFNQE